MPRYATPTVRFWAAVQRTDTCWNWTKGKSEGYGLLCVARKRVRSHAYSWFLHFGPVPMGQCVLHRCDNRACVRPDHLFLGTRADNLADMRSKHREARGAAVSNPGSKNGNAKLKEADVVNILARASAGEPSTRIAASYGVHQSLVHLIRKRKIWRHLTPTV